MPSFTLSRPDVFPSGTTVNAYPASNWSQAALPPSGAPVGSSSASAVATDTGVTFTGLNEDVAYYAYGLVSAEHRYVRFVVDTVSTPGRALDRDQGQPGIVTPTTPQAGKVSAVIAAGWATFGRFVPSRNMTINKIAFIVSTAAGVDDAFSVGIYSPSGADLLAVARTGALSNASPEVVGGGLAATIGLRVVTLPAPAQLTAGQPYYSAFSVVTPFGGTAAQLTQVSDLTAPGATLFGTTPGTGVEHCSKSTSHPLPATVSAPVAAGAVVMLALRES